MISRLVAAVLVAFLLLASCGEEGPSDTQVLCSRFQTAKEDGQTGAMLRALTMMQDPAEAIDPGVRLSAWVLQDDIDTRNPDFRETTFHIRFLLEACMKAES